MADLPPLKDRTVFFVIAACAATAGTTWIVSENVRVKPVSVELARVSNRLKVLQDKEAARTASGPPAPVITDILLGRVKTDTGYNIEQNIFFKDAEGDAAFISFVVLGTNASHLQVTNHNIRVPPEEQVRGANVTRTWKCVTSSYFVKLRAYITDTAGNVSRPHDYTLNC
jgi:hypothetical protein